jgi:hypothetical protein
MLSLINRDLTDSKFHTLSISKMFGMPVTVEVCYNRLIIKLKNVRIDYDDEMKTAFNESIVDNFSNNVNKFTQEQLDKVKLIIDDLTFNKLTGDFELEESCGPNICELKEQDDWYEKWSKENSKIEINKKMGECSVCFDDTMCKGKCGHFLCYACWSKIKFNDCDDCLHHNGDVCDDAQCGEQMCPVCRKGLYVSCN